MSKKLFLRIDFVIILFLGLIPLLWFLKGYNYFGGYDFATYPQPVREVIDNLYLWRNRGVPGYDHTMSIIAFLFYVVFALPPSLGFSFYDSQKIIYIFFFMLPGISMYYLSKNIFNNEKKKRVMIFTAVIFYMFNFATMAKFGRGELLSLFGYGLFPFSIGIFISAVREKKYLKYLFPFGILTVFLATTIGHAADFVLYTISFALFFIFTVLFCNKEERFFIFKFVTVLALVVLLFNLWWILPLGRYLTHYNWHAPILKERHGFIDSLKFVNDYSKTATIFKLFQLKNFTLWFDVVKHGKVPWNESIYNSNLFVFIGMILPVFAYCSLLFKKKRKIILFFALLGILGIFLAKGTHPPLGGIYKWLFLHFPGFMVFRAPWRTFLLIVVFAWAPLLGFFSGRMTEKFEPKLKSFTFLISSAIILLIFLYAWPLFNGAHLRKKGEYIQTGVFVSLPEYYYESSKWLKSQKEIFNIYNPIEAYDITTTWGYHGKDLTFHFLPKPELMVASEDIFSYMYQRPVHYLNDIIEAWQFGDLSKILSLYNIRYVLLQNDLHFWSLPYPNSNDFISSVLKANNIEIEKSFGNLDFYANRSFFPVIFATNNSSIINGSSDAVSIVSMTNYLDKPAFLLLGDNNNSKNSNFINYKFEHYLITDQWKNGNSFIHIPPEYILKGNNFFAVETPKDYKYTLKILRLSPVHAQEKIGFFENFDPVSGDRVMGNDLNRALPLLLTSENNYLKIRFKNANAALDIGGATLRLKIKSGLDLTKYTHFLIRAGVDDFAIQTIGLRIKLDYNNDDLFDKEIVIPSIDIQKNGLQEFKINLYEIISKNLGPRDCFRVLELGINFRTGDASKGFYLKNLAFIGNFGIVPEENNILDTSIRIDNFDFPLHLERSGEWIEVAGLTLKEGLHKLKIVDKEYSYLIRLVPASSTQHILEPKINFSKINPTKYVVDVEAAAPYFLVFSQSYHPDWNAYIEGKKIKFHYMVNGFANGYYIERIGKYKVTLEYWPQRLLVGGAIISIVSILFLLILWIKRIFLLA